jgi:hypothetical protein
MLWPNERSTGIRAARQPARRAAAWAIGLLLLMALLLPAARADDVAPENSCERCHRDPDFLVTNKKLYDYYQEWRVSIHQQEEVGCDDCHGGNARAANKVEAHADGVRASDPASGIHYKNIPDTCGTCHSEILEGFRTSEHFEHVEKKKEIEQGPTCVTCHGSIDSEVLSVNTVAESCARCHNAENGNHPDNPERASAVLNRFLSIQRFYRYITIRAEPEEARTFFESIDPRIQHLSVTWHGFDLDEIDKETSAVLALMKAKRDEIRARRAAAE